MRNRLLPEVHSSSGAGGRFRLDWAGRLCGFVIPRELDGQAHPKGRRCCANTFYVVFLDEHHRFYKGAD